MRIKHLIFLLPLILSFNCGDDKSKTVTNEENSDTIQKLEITQKAIEGLKFNDYILSEDAQQITIKWLDYQQLTTQIEFLKKLDFSFFKAEEVVMKTFISDLKKNIPEVINTNPINARLTVVETALLKLNNDLLIDNLPIEDKLQSIKALLEATSYLNDLINKKLEFDRTDVERPE